MARHFTYCTVLTAFIWTYGSIVMGMPAPQNSATPSTVATATSSPTKSAASTTASTTSLTILTSFSTLHHTVISPKFTYLMIERSYSSSCFAFYHLSDYGCVVTEVVSVEKRSDNITTQHTLLKSLEEYTLFQ